MISQIDGMILELKDNTDLMVDLAYSSLLYNNTEIAEEVIVLSHKMSDLADRIQDILADAAKSSPEEISRAIVTVRLMDSILDIAEAAESIADTVIRGLADHPVLAMSIRGADTTICLARVAPDSVLADRNFGQLSLATKSSMFVIAVRRGGDYIFGPDRNVTIRADDILIAKGPEDSVGYFKDLADGTEKDIGARSVRRCSRGTAESGNREAQAYPWSMAAGRKESDGLSPCEILRFPVARYEKPASGIGLVTFYQG